MAAPNRWGAVIALCCVILLAIFISCWLLLPADQPVKICVRSDLSESCNQMAQDQPDSYTCIVALDELSCSRQVHEGEADITRGSPRAIYLAGKHLNLAPITTELVDGKPHRYQAVAVVSKNSDINGPADLRDRPSCHTGQGRTAGWDIPLGRLMASGLAMAVDCDRDSELDIAEAFFGSACAPGNWSDQTVVQEELRRRHPSMCSRCSDPSSCSSSDSYAGYEGALRCLTAESGEVAFTKLSALREFMAKEPDFVQNAELLCFEGGRKALDHPEPCFWGARPTDAFMVSSVQSEAERNRIAQVLLETQARYSVVPQVPTPDWYYKSFLSSPKVTSIQKVGPERDTYRTYLGNFVTAISKPRNETCRNHAVAFCVTSETQASQVVDLRLAVEARGLWPPVSFVRADGAQACARAVAEGQAQMVVLDGGDIYKAGKAHGLLPVAAELHEGSDASYYAVAVVPRSLEDVKKLEDLRGRRSCHTGLGRTAGWVMPVGALRSAGLLPEGCDHAAAVAEFFSEGSCVPGANDTRYNPDRSGHENLCRRCVGDDEGMHVCSRDPSKERYAGYAGSFRCVAAGAGDVAFVKHSTVGEHTDGNGGSTWDADLSSADYRLLCAEGDASDVADYLRCNLGKVPAHHVMTSSDATPDIRLCLAKLSAGLSSHFGPGSSLYRLLGRGEPGLLFGQAAQALGALPLDSTYEVALGEKFLAASRATDPQECQ